MEKFIRMFPECYIKLSDIADRSNLSLSTTLNVIIQRMLSNKKKYKFVDNSVYFDFINNTNKKINESGNMILFHWYCSKESINSFYKICKIPHISNNLKSDSLVINYLIREFKGFKVKTIEKLSTKNKRLLNIKERYYKYNLEKSRLLKDGE